jgi:N-acetyl-gamma-glutamylphosphate reductase
VLDNLSKGASSQAIQALNVARDWPEELGLPLVAQFP